MTQYSLYLEDKNGTNEVATLLCRHDYDAMEQVKQMLMPIVAMVPYLSLYRALDLKNAYRLKTGKQVITFIIQKSKL